MMPNKITKKAFSPPFMRAGTYNPLLLFADILLR